MPCEVCSNPIFNPANAVEIIFPDEKEFICEVCWDRMGEYEREQWIEWFVDRGGTVYE